MTTASLQLCGASANDSEIDHAAASGCASLTLETALVTVLRLTPSRPGSELEAPLPPRRREWHQLPMAHHAA